MNAETRPGETSLILSAMVFRQGIDRQVFCDEQHLPVTAKYCKIREKLMKTFPWLRPDFRCEAAVSFENPCQSRRL